MYRAVGFRLLCHDNSPGSPVTVRKPGTSLPVRNRDPGEAAGARDNDVFVGLSFVPGIRADFCYRECRGCRATAKEAEYKEEGEDAHI